MEEYYREDREFHIVLNLPEDIKEQVGDDSLFIELEVDTREEQGWIEEVTMITYTLHTSQKQWLEAEETCHSEGGHLVSVTSEEVHEIVKELVAADKSYYFWLGGRNELGEWRWSDNSTWEYTQWNRGNQMIWIAAVSTPALTEDGLTYRAVKNISLFAKEKES